MVICETWLFELFFLNTTILIYRSTDSSKCFRGSLRFRDNESRLYSDNMIVKSIPVVGAPQIT